MPAARRLASRGWGTGALLCLVGSVVLELSFSGRGGILIGRYRMLVVLGGWWLLFAAGVWCVAHLPRRAAVLLVVAGTLALHTAGLVRGPQTSDDIYRYIWDGKVQAAGIDPYRYPPDDPQVASLRSAFLWPGPAACAEQLRAPGCTRLNRPSARTIYPPLGELWFLGLHALYPPGDALLALQLPNALVDLAVVGLLLALLRTLGRDPRWAVLYAWCPLVVAETAMDGHVDALETLLAVAGLSALVRRRAAFGSGLLAAAAMVKLFPALLLPVALRRRPVRAAAAAALVVGVGYLPHVLAVGTHVLGFLPDYLMEEKYDEGSRFVLLGLLGLSGRAAQAVALGSLAVVALSVLRDRGQDVPGLALRLLGTAFLLATPVQPWYSLLLVAVVALDGRWEWLALGAAAYPLYFAAVLDGDTVRVGRVSYSAALALIVIVGLLRRRRRQDLQVAVGPAGDVDDTGGLVDGQRVGLPHGREAGQLGQSGGVDPEPD
ncbi:MAG: glycosyltransferase 87 family protein [Actinomycetota bacterium]|nr:glycosyltransferase 87 family protein [Actinomycetota bacterium]